MENSIALTAAVLALCWGVWKKSGWAKTLAIFFYLIAIGSFVYGIILDNPLRVTGKFGWHSYATTTSEKWIEIGFYTLIGFGFLKGWWGKLSRAWWRGK